MNHSILSPTSQFQATFFAAHETKPTDVAFLLDAQHSISWFWILTLYLAGSFVAFFFLFLGVFRLHVSDWYFCAVVVEKG